MAQIFIQHSQNCSVLQRWCPDSKTVPNDIVFQLLELSRMFISNDAHEVAIHKIHDCHISICHCHLISLSVKYNIDKLFIYTFKRLVKACLDDLTPDEHAMLHPHLWATILKAQSTLWIHWRIVACESPAINHVADCLDTDNCSLNWHQLWWNVIGHSLLDRRNPQPYKDAVQRCE